MRKTPRLARRRRRSLLTLLSPLLLLFLCLSMFLLLFSYSLGSRPERDSRSSVRDKIFPLSFSIYSFFIFSLSFSHLLLQNARSQYANLHLHSCPILLNFPSTIRLNIRNSKFASFPFRDHDRLVCEFVKPKSITWIHHRKLFGLLT